MSSIFSLLQSNRHPSKALSFEDVTQYVQASTVLSQKGTKCSDARYLPNQGRGMLSRPGADCGYVMVLKAINRKKNLGLTTQQCFDAVFNVVKKLNGAFYFHTDEYDEARNSYIGCDHLSLAARPGFSWEYEVRSKDVQEMVRYAKGLDEVSADVTMTQLTGENQERGILLVYSKDYTVVPNNPKRHQMFRIYDIERDKAFMRQLVQVMKIRGVSYDDMLREAELQLEATLQHLAVGLPVFAVKFVKDNPQVNYVRHIVRKSLFSRVHLPFAAPQYFIRK